MKDLFEEFIQLSHGCVYMQCSCWLLNGFSFRGTRMRMRATTRDVMCYVAKNIQHDTKSVVTLRCAVESVDPIKYADGCGCFLQDLFEW